MKNIDAINNILGLPIETLNSLRQLAAAINSDASFSIILCMHLI